MSKEDEYDKVKMDQFEASQRLESEEIYQLRQKKKQIAEDLPEQVEKTLNKSDSNRSKQNTAAVAQLAEAHDLGS